jgi:hypothetical protein
MKHHLDLRVKLKMTAGLKQKPDVHPGLEVKIYVPLGLKSRNSGTPSSLIET